MVKFHQLMGVQDTMGSTVPEGNAPSDEREQGLKAGSHSSLLKRKQYRMEDC